jgi:hypothetical protein
LHDGRKPTDLPISAVKRLESSAGGIKLVKNVNRYIAASHDTAE